MIPHSKPTIGEEELSAATTVLSSGYIAQGEKVTEFERQFARFHGLKKAIAVNSGTSALHLALLAVGVKTGDEVIIPSFVCTALLNAVNYIGAVPVIADIDEEDYNMSFSDTEKRITKRTKAIIIPHMFGNPCRETMRFKETGIPIIEDCAQSIGAKINGENVGTIGDISIFSFYATKMMTTGEGGMIASNSLELIEKVSDLRDYDNKEDYKVRYNYKMTDIQAAMGIEQIKRLPDFISKRMVIADRYNKGLKDLPLKIPIVLSGSEGVWFRYVICCEKRDALIDYLHKNGVGAARPVFKPLHIFLKNKNGCPVTEKVWNTAVSLPIYPSLSESDINEVIKSIRLFFS